MNKRVLVAVIAFILLAVGSAVFLIFHAQDNKSETDTPTQTTYPVKVYFSKASESYDDPTKTYPVDRKSPDLGVAKYVIKQLLAGPTATEAESGYFSDVKVRSDASDCQGDDFTITIKNNVATLRFCRTFDAIGTMSDARAQEEIKASLLQFNTIKKVIILSKTGDCQFDASGLNLCKE